MVGALSGEKGAGAGSPPNLKLFTTSDEFEPSQVEEACDNIRENVAWCRERGVPRLTWSDRAERKGPLLICGGGPSLKDTEGELRDLIAQGGTVLAINDTHDWLYDRGIVPDMLAMHEIAPWPIDFITRANTKTTYYLASFAHPTAYERLKDCKVVMFHSYGGPPTDPTVAELDPGHPIITGGEAMSLRSINLGWFLGWTDIHTFGVDGCYRVGTSSHTYFDRPMDASEVTCAGRTFIAPYYLARQADDLRRLLIAQGHLFNLTTHGDGLVQHLHRTMMPLAYARAA